MATYEEKGQLTYKDEQGNLHLLHPKTKMDCVDGLEETLGGKAPKSHTEDKNNPHGVTASQVGAVAKSGDTMTGMLTLPKLVVDNSDWAQQIPFWNGSKEVGGIYRQNDNGLFVLYFRHPNAAAQEYYCMPLPNASLSDNKWYDILTSKKPVTLAQGGTGRDMSSVPAGAVIRNSGDGSGLYYTAPASGALYATSSSGNPKFGTLPIAQGGTGATTTADALKNLSAFRDLGNNVMPYRDIINNWSIIDSGYSYYSELYLEGQPSQYGLLLHFHYSTEVFQFWRCLPGGPTYWRSGNASGWHGSWTKVYDTANKPTPADIGAAASSHNHSASNITSGTLPIARGGTGASDIWNALANLGLRQFRTYYFDNCSSPLLTLQNNYNSIDNVACLIYCVCGGTRYALVGYKVDNYAAFMEIGYGTADLYKYRNYNGTWTMHTYKAG